MVKLNLELDGDKMEFNIPDRWEEVTVDTFSKIWKIDRENLTEIELTVEIVEILTGVDEDILYMMSPDEFTKLTKIIGFTNEDIKGTQVESIMVGDVEYFLKKDFDKLTMGEVISLELLIEQSGGNMASKMAEMLCIFLRRKKENGKLESFKKSFMERAEEFKGVSIADVNDIFLFFSDGENLSTSNTKASLEN